ncbi:hypothetical protein L3Q82_012992%2C partial [Scomber scombrus]|uniref:Uncharacterized protein n=1 Tax=Scomber scombrus TaxID=13677 RepID=A0AAV1NHP5_SCOSC
MKRRSGLLRTADGVSRSRLGVQSGVSRHGDDQIVTVPLVPLETAPESMPVPTSSSSPAATAAGGSGPDRAAVTGQVGQISLRVTASAYVIFFQQRVCTARSKDLQQRQDEDAPALVEQWNAETVPNNESATRHESPHQPVCEHKALDTTA